MAGNKLSEGPDRQNSLARGAKTQNRILGFENFCENNY